MVASRSSSSSPGTASGSKTSPMSVSSSSGNTGSSSNSKKRRSRSSSASSQSSSGSSSSSSSSNRKASKHTGESSKNSSSRVESVVSKDRKPSSSSTSSYSPKRKHRTEHRNRDRRSPSREGRRGRDGPVYGNKIFIGRLSEKINRNHLQEIFGLYGHVMRVDLPVDHFRGFGSRGFAFIEYKHKSDAKAAAYHMNGGKIDGQRIIVEEFDPAASNTAILRPRRMSPDRRPPPYRPSSRYYRRKY